MGGYQVEIYQIQNLEFSYPEGDRKILKQINLEIKEGDFVVLCGKSGSGKTTLLRHLKPVLTPYGETSGTIQFKGANLTEIDERTQASDIGFVPQNPDNQIVTDKVWHELAFGLESLGYDQHTIRLRVAEMASFFGIGTWFMKDVTQLSGGQKQLLNLASIMAMQPKVLILDEPTSQLDPIVATEFLDTLKKINSELGVTIILTEHRLEEAFPLADQVIVMEDGQILFHDTPANIGKALKHSGSEMRRYVPAAMKIYAGIDVELPCPITVRDGRRLLNQLDLKAVKHAMPERTESNNPVALELNNVYFKYEKDSPDVLAGLSMKVKQREIYAVLGGNGAGKTTLISVMAHLQKAYRGKIKLNSKAVGVLPQDPQSLFIKNTVMGELKNMTSDKVQMGEVITFTEIAHLLEQHPYDLSGGEQQRLALCKVLLMNPEILLLDEPTKGLDNEFKEKLGQLLLKLKAAGKTIVMVSHDIEFCAMFADTCALMFQGDIVTSGMPHEFFAGNSFYTTAANRIARHIWNHAITTEEVIRLCRQSATM